MEPLWRSWCLIPVGPPTAERRMLCGTGSSGSRFPVVVHTRPACGLPHGHVDQSPEDGDLPGQALLFTPCQPAVHSYAAIAGLTGREAGVLTPPSRTQHRLDPGDSALKWLLTHWYVSRETRICCSRAWLHGDPMSGLSQGHAGKRAADRVVPPELSGGPVRCVLR